MKLRCLIHGVVLIVEGNKRHIMPPPGSYGYPCRLVSDLHPTEGKMGDCEIVKEKG